MKSLIPWKETKSEATGNGGSLVPSGGLAFYLRRMRDEFDHLFDRFTPPGIDKEKVEARYHNGVLTVRFAKTAESKARRVPVKTT